MGASQSLNKKASNTDDSLKKRKNRYELLNTDNDINVRESGEDPLNRNSLT